jgi:hypothetical protein
MGKQSALVMRAPRNQPPAGNTKHLSISGGRAIRTFCQPARLAPDLGYDSLSNLAKLVADGSAKRPQE